MTTDNYVQTPESTKLNEYVDKPKLDRSIKGACEIIGCRFADLEYNDSDANFANSPTYTKQANSNDISGYENKVKNKNALLLNSSAPDSKYYRDYYLDIGDGVIAHFNYSDKDKSKTVLMPLWSDVSINTEDTFVDEAESEDEQVLTDSVQCDWKARAKSPLENELFVDFD